MSGDDRETARRGAARTGVVAEPDVSALVLHGDRWDGPRMDEWSVSRPSIADLDAALRRLDAERYTMVTVAIVDDVAHLSVGGGAGRYVVYMTFDNERFWTLLRGDEVTGRELLVCGGQEGEFAARFIVTLADARAAAVEFMASQERTSELRWEES